MSQYLDESIFAARKAHEVGRAEILERLRAERDALIAGRTEGTSARKVFVRLRDSLRRITSASQR